MRPALASALAADAPARVVAEQERSLAATAALFRALATPVRLKIVGALLECELPTAGLMACTQASQPNLSMHLGVLRRAGIVRRRRDPRGFCYRLSEDAEGQEGGRLYTLMLAEAMGMARTGFLT